MVHFLSATVVRRIAAGEVPVRREPRGRRHRVYVMLDDDPPEDLEQDVKLLRRWPWPRSGIRGLEEQVAFLQGQLVLKAGAAAQRRIGQRIEVSAGKTRPLEGRFWDR